MRSSRHLVATALAAAAAVAAFVYVIWPSPPTGEAPVSHAPLKESDRVRLRLDQLRAQHPDWGAARGALQARHGVAAVPRTGQARGDAGTGTRAEMPNSGPAPDAAADGSQIIEEDTDDIPTMTKIAIEDQDPDRRLAAVTALGASENPEAIPVLAQALSDSDEEVRMEALQALSDFTDEPPVEAIESALNDPAPDIRFEALGVLADIGGERARSAVEKALNDPDEDVRGLAEGIMDLESTYEDEMPPPQAPSAQGQPGHESPTE